MVEIAEGAGFVHHPEHTAYTLGAVEVAFTVEIGRFVGMDELFLMEIFEYGIRYWVGTVV